jgi:3-deoxy-D-manno-octulosonate 8-phosphate phosphatase (KDO 8-P phosphatase)
MLDLGTLSSVELIAFDFDGVFTDNTVYVQQDGIESVRCWRSDGIGLSRLRTTGVHMLIISTEVNTVVKTRANKLKLPCKQGVEDKAMSILEACRELGVSPIHTMFVGNDINDIPAFKAIGIPVAVADAYPEVYPHVLFRTHKSGGFGAVREICDLVYQAKLFGRNKQ